MCFSIACFLIKHNLDFRMLYEEKGQEYVLVVTTRRTFPPSRLLTSPNPMKSHKLVVDTRPASSSANLDAYAFLNEDPVPYVASSAS